MLFNSYVFMLAFLPLTLLCYFLLGRLPEKIQLNKVFLVLASFLFYGYNNPSYVPIIAGSILINYALSQLMLTQRKKALRLPLMLLGLFLNLGVLFYFKYHDFFFENLNGAFGLHLTLNHLALPLGISFFTFQQLSYVIDSSSAPCRATTFWITRSSSRSSPSSSQGRSCCTAKSCRSLRM